LKQDKNNMRIQLKLSTNSEPIPFAHLHHLAGTLHKWIGEENEIHGDLSLYSFSWLKGTEKTKQGQLECRHGATWIISAHNKAFMKKIISGVMDDPKVCFGMTVKEIVFIEMPDFSNKERFVVGSPVLVKKKIEGEKYHKHLIFKDAETESIMTRILESKLLAAGLDENNISVRFDDGFHSPKTKSVNYRGIKNIANICPVIVEGTPEQIGFAWNVGIGHSTGIGFGALN
jgi:CRISPR-associated endoribonuclease Cas6